jgi:hypothetical protein
LSKILKEIEMEKFIELDLSEMKEINGGGWLADAVHYIKCNSPSMAEYGQWLMEHERVM